MNGLKRNRGHSVWLPLALLVLASGAVCADQKLYSLEIPEGQAAHFEVPFWVSHPGEISVQAEWSGNRPLAFRIEPPGGAGVAKRRSGPSPVHLRMVVETTQLKQGPWTLVIHALPLSGSGTGRLTINTPEETSPTRTNSEPTSLFPPEPDEPIETWQKPRAARGELEPSQRHVIQTTESFRELLVEASQRPPDTCRWQDDLLQWLASQRDRLLDEDARPDAATGQLMTRMVEVIRAVDGVRTSEDPLLVGPPPTDRSKRAGWERLRDSRLRPVERSLDELLNAVQRNHAPELQGEDWPLRMVSCLTATERYFEQRWIEGPDRAPNRELAEAQWRPLNRAATALEALAEMAPDDKIRLRTRN